MNKLAQMCGAVRKMCLDGADTEVLMRVAAGAARLAAAAHALTAVAASALNDVQLVQTLTGQSVQQVRAQIRLGDAMRAGNLPILAGAARAGNVAAESANSIVGLLYGREASVSVAEAEAELTAAAVEGLPAESVQRQVRRWRETLEPSIVARDEKWALENRGLRLGTTQDGLISINGRLVPETAALLERLFSAAITSKEGLPDARTPNQKRHDAFTAMLGAAAGSSDTPSKGGAPVSVVIQVGPRGNAYLQDHEGDLTPVGYEAASHGACAGTLQLLAQDARGKILSLSGPQRVFNHHQRRAIGIRDGGCVIPGCETPPGWCEIHHVQPHARGGPTSVDNGVMLCWYHHRHSHEWHVTIEDGIPRAELTSVVRRALAAARG